MAITANKKFWTEFIGLYEKLPCLWDNQHENYGNRDKRNESWDELVVKLRDVEPDANHDAAKRKINTFRSNFNREVRKIRLARDQGFDIYHPTLWYFDHLSFLLTVHDKTTNLSNSPYLDDDTKLSLKFVSCDINPNSTVSNSFQEQSTRNNFYPRLYRKSQFMKERLKRNLSTSEEIEDNTKTGNFCDESDKNETSVVNKLAQHFAYKQQFDDIKSPNISKVARRRGRKGVRPKISRRTATNQVGNGDKVDENIHELHPRDISSLPNLESVDMDFEHNSNVEQENDSIKISNKLYSDPKVNCYSSNMTIASATSLQHVEELPQHHRNSEERDNIDEADIYGRAWSCSYRKLSHEQKLYAKKAIDEILVLGQLNALNLHTVSISSNTFGSLQ